MKKFTQNLFYICGLIFLLNACSSDDGNNTPTVISYSQTGLLGKEITIEIQNSPHGNLQVFFDNEQAQAYFASESKIIAVVPRSLQNPTPTLKIIDLNTNETIFNENFALNAPVISSYEANEATFGETFIIYGENFDDVLDDIVVFVNDQPAQIVASTYNKIEILLPEAITNSNLQLKVGAQRQMFTSTFPLHLKAPIIDAVENSVAWIASQLVISGQNFNPNPEFGEAFVNNIPCQFYIYDGKLNISTPPGKYNEFQITNVTYRTAGQSVSFNTNIPIANDGIMVDYSNNVGWNHTIFEHADKAYNLVSTTASSDGDANYVLLEFSPTTEKWTTLASFQYNGRIADAVYDGADNLYLYKYFSGSNSYGLTKLNMNTFIQEPLALPENHISNPILFAYQNNLYLLSGLNLVNGSYVTRTQKYKYSNATNSWTTLPSSTFSEMPLVDSQGSGKCNYMHFNNSIYISYGINFKTYKITNSLAVTEYPYNFSFGYQNKVIGRLGNGTSQTLYNIVTNSNATMQADIFGYGNEFFAVNNQIYFIRNSWTSYYQNTYYTQKLRPSILNEIL